MSNSFPNLESAVAAFMVFDRDDNGDATRDEIEMACLQIHREKMSLEASMKDLDGAVRKLDSVSGFSSFHVRLCSYRKGRSSWCWSWLLSSWSCPP